jgi:hypothetical protein
MGQLRVCPLLPTCEKRARVRGPFFEAPSISVTGGAAQGEAGASRRPKGAPGLHAGATCPHAGAPCPHALAPRPYARVPCLHARPPCPYTRAPSPHPCSPSPDERSSHAGVRPRRRGACSVGAGARASGAARSLPDEGRRVACCGVDWSGPGSSLTRHDSRASCRDLLSTSGRIVASEPDDLARNLVAPRLRQGLAVTEHPLLLLTSWTARSGPAAGRSRHGGSRSSRHVTCTRRGVACGQHRGRVREIIWPRKLVYTWRMGGDAEETSLVTVRFESAAPRPRSSSSRSWRRPRPPGLAREEGWNGWLDGLAGFFDA